MLNYTRNGWGRSENTLQTSGEDVKIHSKRVRKIHSTITSTQIPPMSILFSSMPVLKSRPGETFDLLKFKLGKFNSSVIVSASLKSMLSKSSLLILFAVQTRTQVELFAKTKKACFKTLIDVNCHQLVIFDNQI